MLAHAPDPDGQVAENIQRCQRNYRGHHKRQI